MMIHVLALSVIAVVLRHPEMVDDSMMGPALPTPLSEVEEPIVEIISPDMGSNIELSLKSQDDTRRPSFATAHGYRDIFTHRSLNHQDLNVGVVVTFCTFAITLLMVFGAVKGKPSYLMPFFCLQVFDFCIASLTAVGYLCYLPDIHHLVADNPHMPFQEELLRLNPQCLSLLVLFTFMVAMMVKAYFIGVVWSCYKYLSLRLVAAQRTIHYIDPDSQSLLPDLPDYETAVAILDLLSKSSQHLHRHMQAPRQQWMLHMSQPPFRSHLKSNYHLNHKPSSNCHLHPNPNPNPSHNPSLKPRTRHLLKHLNALLLKQQLKCTTCRDVMSVYSRCDIYVSKEKRLNLIIYSLKL
ncbi:hypothetical protein ANN_12184 [Periplaneta americana]|uniref:Lysosomal-associated transmembrane protein 4A n=1 Tax=Periplaneta americana TaxID=6978 RepID=A0ABQ8THZ6_PERAM|nr:hypothetical protein ANN_12184 [Periplaneta americana]